ncbi:ATP-grasp domain-containing protein [Haloarculaceae archaeon H-GB11]|nr:ATP-grasp domain-containing protein [Haloarculaceae archaeon H-GB11]
MSSPRGGVLVLDANGQGGLHVVRSLGRRGVPVTAGSHRRRSLGGVSRYSDGTYRYPDPEDRAEVFLDHLEAYLDDVAHFAVIPVRDRTSVLLSKHKERLEATGTEVAVADWSTFERTYDKGRFFGLTDPLAVPQPSTVTPASVEDVRKIASDVPYPAVVKPRSKTAWDDSGRCHYTEIDDANYVESPAELVETYQRVLDDNPFLEATDHYPLVQEYVDGETTTTVVLADEGKILAHFQEQRVRTYPASGGNSTVLRALDDPQMLEYAAAVVEALDWTGPAMVEFMRTPDGDYSLIEMNGRYWGSVPFAIERGVDFPWLHYKQLRGVSSRATSSYRTDGLHQRLLNEDLLWLGEQLERGRFAAVLPFLWTCVVANQTFSSRTDPVPSLVALWQTATIGACALPRGLGRLSPTAGDLQSPVRSATRRLLDVLSPS